MNLFLTPAQRLSRWIALALLASHLLCQAASRELWVAPNGSDRSDGTRAQPLASLEAARDRIREWKGLGPLPPGGVVVSVAAGIYSRSSAFDLEAADSGMPGSPILYRGLPGAAPRLLGGRPIKFEPVTDPEILRRLGPASSNHVRVADLRAQGVTHLGRMTSRGFGRPTVPSHLELFVGGRPMTLARWPNEGEWLRIAGFPEDSAQPDDHGGKIGDLKSGFSYDGDRPRSWAPSSNIWVHGYWAWDWANSYERVEQLDAEARRVRTASPHGLYGFRKGQRFYFLNVLEELDRPGEYCLDEGTGRLYFWPPEGGAGADDCVVSVVEAPLIRLRGASDIVLSNLVLEATRGGGIRVENGSSNRVEACLLRNLGNWGIEISGGQGHVVRGCEVRDSGDGGVMVSGGDRQRLVPAGHRVEQSWFERQGRWSKCYVPAILIDGVGISARHNLIEQHPHCAILFGGNDHLIEFNEIHHVALETGDVGAIYTGRDWTYRGNRILNNYVHDTGGVGMGAMGAYMDDCVSGTEIRGNVFVRVTRAAFLGGGRDHRVENNVFVDCQPAVAIDGRGLDTAPVWHGMVYQTMKARLQAMPRELYRQRYPELLALDRFYQSDAGVPPENNIVQANVSAGGKWIDIGWHARPDMITVTRNLVTNDVTFVRIEGKSLRFRDDARARETGFRPIPFERIGPEGVRPGQ